MPHDLDRLFRLYHRELQSMAYRRVGDHALAEDLAQDTFVRYAGMGRQQPAQHVDQPRFFLIRVLHNLIIDLGRSRARRGKTATLEDVQDELVDPSPCPARLLELRQQLQLLQLALEELPDNCRQALLLNRLDGLSHAQVAEQLDVSPSMVSKYIMRALRHCARRLGLVQH